MSDAPGVALVTGAAGGIGRAVVERLVRDGMRVGALDVNQEGLVALAADLPDVLALTADVTDENEIRAAFESLRGQWGEPDVVVNVAGYFARHRVPDLSRSD